MGAFSLIVVINLLNRLKMGKKSAEMKEKVILNKHTVDFTTGTDFPGNYPLMPERPFKAEEYAKNIVFDVVFEEDASLEFDIIGVDAPIANALRRVLLSEVPSVAIEKVLLYNNTSIVQDEILCHRLGLIPLNIDPRKVEWRTDKDNLEPHPSNTVVFDLKVRCTKNTKANKDETDRKKLYKDSYIYASHLSWVPIGNQKESFGYDVKPIYGDILLAKMLPGHEIDLRCLCYKGIGRDHAKFSPVATASYRLMPSITIKEPICGDDAYKFQEYFASGVIAVETNKQGVPEAKVANERLDTCNRQVLEDEEMKEKVEVAKVRNHYLFTVESVSFFKPNELVLEALDVLCNKCDTLIDFLEN